MSSWSSRWFFSQHMAIANLRENIQFCWKVWLNVTWIIGRAERFVQFWSTHICLRYGRRNHFLTSFSVVAFLGQFHQCPTDSFSTRRFTPILHSTEHLGIFYVKVEHIFKLCILVKLDVILLLKLNCTKEWLLALRLVKPLFR